jgi:molecular chaperone GrpE (heat shock protein)
LSSEEQQRREGEAAGEPSGEVPRAEEPRGEETPRPESADGSTEGEASGPVEVNGSEGAEVVPELPPDAFDEEPEDAAEIADEEILALAGELEAARRERDEYLDDMRRMKAEMENSRKRLERDRARYVQLAAERLVRELLPVLDNLERALDIEGDVREGVKATRDQMLGVLEGAGLEPVLSDGESFDPSVHEAVMGQPSEEHEEDTVIQTLERGYLLNGRPVRPAKVIVAKQV